MNPPTHGIPAPITGDSTVGQFTPLTHYSAFPINPPTNRIAAPIPPIQPSVHLSPPPPWQWVCRRTAKVEQVLQVFMGLHSKLRPPHDPSVDSLLHASYSWRTPGARHTNRVRRGGGTRGRRGGLVGSSVGLKGRGQRREQTRPVETTEIDK